MKITTNFVPRNLIRFDELPTDAQNFFGYIKDDDIYSPRFVCYKNNFYDVFETIIANAPAQWDSIEFTSAFSGVVFKILLTDDKVICGLAYW